MDIKELNSFKLSDAVKFHDKLNPNLWMGSRLDPAVKKQLLLIAEDFITELGIKDLDVEDVTISGSNAAYTYTPHSDLDLHILVDMDKFPADEVYRELFQAKKTLYNDTHDISVHGVPVELYVQDKNQPVVSLGEYSLLKDKWLKFPTKRRANLDQNATRAKYERLKELVELALRTRDLERVTKALSLIKRYRKAGLDKGGEFSPENLAFKVIRKQGGIQKLYDLRNQLHSEELTIEEMYSGPKMKFLKPGELKGSYSDYQLLAMGFKKSQNGSWYIPQVKWDKLIASSQIGEDDLNEKYAKEFEEYDPTFNIEEGADNTPSIGINIRDDGDIRYADLIVDGKKKYESRRTNSLNPYIGKTVGIIRTGKGPAVAIGQATIGEPIIVDADKFDKLRNQHLVPKNSKFDIDSDGTKYLYPMINPIRWDNEKPIKHKGIVSRKIQEQDVAEGIFDRFKKHLTADRNGIHLTATKDEKRLIVDAIYNDERIGNAIFQVQGKNLVAAGVGVAREYQGKGIGRIMYDWVKELGYTLNRSPYQTDAGKGFWDKHKGAEQNVWEASGYIPSAKEKNDPRFKTALTVDVKPDSIKKNAKAFSWLTSRAGIPPDARPDGKI